MANGALSQAEIDALLSGGSSGSSGSGTGGREAAVIEGFLKAVLPAQSEWLAEMAHGAADFSAPQVAETERAAFLAEIPATVTSVKIDFTAGFCGEHLFIMTDDAARGIASIMNREENIALDGMALSVIGETVAQIVKTQLAALSAKTGGRVIAAAAPETANIPKAAVPLPSGGFLAVAYELRLGDTPQKMWELFDLPVATAIADAIEGRERPADQPSDKPANSQPAADKPTEKPTNKPSGVPIVETTNKPIGEPANKPTVEAADKSADEAAVETSGEPVKMRTVRFPALNNTADDKGPGNIGLLLDVSMEMTVELGRTKKLIKEILTLGEGSIIELDKPAGEPVDILVNGKLIARGEVVVIDENFGVRVTEIVSPRERLPQAD